MSKQQYISICKSAKGVPVFMQPWWLDAVCDNWDAAIAMKGEHVAGIWAYPVEQKLGVTMMRTPALTPYLGPHIFFPADVKESRLDSFEHETIAELMRQLPPAKVWHLAIQPGIKQVGLFKQHRLRTQVQQTFLISLKDDEAIIFANMKESMRRNIRVAEKELTVTNDLSQLDRLYDFHEKTLSKKGKPLPYTFAQFEKIMTACKAHDAGTLWAAREGDDVKALVWQVWDAHRSYYFVGAQQPGGGNANANALSLLLWHAIKEAKRRGHTTFDLEGSMDEGVERFFRSFGGQRTLYMVLLKNDSLLWKIKKAILK